ncbi:MAG: ABC transporter permease [Planctomycetes bacterium]|nr:ABC transporter permease [Planctomycetota bacterium]MCC7171831.1 ABC transporter permease [Planctomycetota bacterium]
MSADAMLAFLVAALFAAMPILLAGLGEYVVERSGALNVGVEGTMLAGAFAAFALERLGVPPLAVLALVAGIGFAIGVGFGGLTVGLGCEPVVSGLMLNTLALGATAVGFDAVLEVVTAREGVLAASGAVAGLDPRAIVVATAVLLVVVAIVLPCTRVGLELRACGHDAEAARAAGVRVDGLRTSALALGGCLAALAGAQLLYSGPGTFVEGMTEGRGFLALAAVVCARGQLLRVVVFALAFGALTVFQFHAQSLGTWSHHLLLAAPYVVTLVALALAPGRVERRSTRVER